MSALRFNGFEGLGLLVIGLIVGYIFSKFRHNLVPQKKQSAQERRRSRAENAQKNIAGRIRNSLTEGLPENLQWGHLLKVSSDQNTVFITRELNPGTTRSILAFSAHCHDGEGVMIRLRVPNEASISQIMYTSNPSNPALTRLIGDAMDYLKTWKPE